jgi:H+/Cl- antiporter ClcA
MQAQRSILAYWSILLLRAVVAIASALGTFQLCWTLFWGQVGKSGWWTLMAFVYPAWVSIFVAVAIAVAACVLVFTQRFQGSASPENRASGSELPNEG